MNKYWIIGLVLATVALIIYYTGLYTYFTPTYVDEVLPGADVQPVDNFASSLRQEADEQSKVVEAEFSNANQESTAERSTTASPTTLRIGQFGDVDFVHKGSGEAKIITLAGKQYLRLENFSVTSGPDLYVYLTDNTNPTSDVSGLGEYIDLGLLKGTSGNQNYEITTELAGRNTAVIWCKRFGVLFSYAVMD